MDLDPEDYVIWAREKWYQWTGILGIPGCFILGMVMLMQSHEGLQKRRLRLIMKHKEAIITLIILLCMNVYFNVCSHHKHTILETSEFLV